MLTPTNRPKPVAPTVFMQEKILFEMYLSRQYQPKKVWHDAFDDHKPHKTVAPIVLMLNKF